MKLKEGQVIVCIGDSITDCGRRGESGPLGNGYVRLFHHLLQAAFPGNQRSIINKGIGGQTLAELQMRWADDVLYHQPDWVTILIGINDLHRVLRKADGWSEHTVENFRRRYREVLTLTREKLPRCRLVLLEPFYVTTQTTEGWRQEVLKDLQPYQEVVAKISQEFDANLVKLQDIFRQQLQFFEAEQLAPDAVHPTLLGHTIIAWHLFQHFLER
ncbi:MAG TPA: SGNH/GDSL hydrolase family protein [bacterium]|nr:SGNH/GDSL hydrolase family protein [bacterium]HOL66190.1 SGNH/GDSL hydrolase family protein [bacterium]HPP13233.1 SGNH/GDSL hydrolase family protein [bacterium]